MCLDEFSRKLLSAEAATQAAFMQLAGGVDPLNQGSTAASSSHPPTAVSSTPKSTDGVVRDLGVVGRGNKRIKLAPVPLAGEAANIAYIIP